MHHKYKSDSRIVSLNQKLSSVLEQSSPYDKNYDFDEANSSDYEVEKQMMAEKSKRILAKAKTLLEKRVKIPKNDPFLTAIHVYNEEREERETDAPSESGKTSDMEMLRDLILDEAEPKDDLIELRKMINRTKRNISNYASDLYNLKQNVDEVQKEYRELGYKSINDDLMYNLDKAYTKYMPNGDKKKLFEYDFYENPEKKREIILKNKTKNGERKSVLKGK